MLASPGSGSFIPAGNGRPLPPADATLGFPEVPRAFRCSAGCAAAPPSAGLWKLAGLLVLSRQPRLWKSSNPASSGGHEALRCCWLGCGLGSQDTQL